MGREIILKTSQDEPFNAYLAGDEAADSAVLILHEWWGVMPHNRLWTDRLADIGHLALVVDLYDGRTTDDPALAAERYRQLKRGCCRPGAVQPPGGSSHPAPSSPSR
ncbi:MAG: dienelactone hydrolase family protein [Candidatus Thiodiazotropha sp.]